MADKTRIGVIGLGYWGPNLLRNLDSLKEECSVDVLCDMDQRVLDNYKGRASAKLTKDYREVCRNKDLDAVIISTPTSTHYEVYKEALKNGKDVFCEKPLTNRLDHADELVNLASEKERVAMVGNIFVYHPAVKALKKMIDSGELGEVYEISCARKGHGPIRSDVNAMWDLASHDAYILLRLFGRSPDGVSAFGHDYLPGTEVEDSVSLNMRFGKRAGGKIDVSWLQPVKERRVTVVGSKGMAVFDDSPGQRPITIYDKSTQPHGSRQTSDYADFKMVTTDGDIRQPLVPSAEPMKLELQHFLECCRSRETPLTDASHGRDVVRILTRAEESMNKNGEWTEI
tara:strand:- start:906 stop:1931 length:1026 start_codon:yes stop_codon:yes gene_type:complete